MSMAEYYRYKRILGKENDPEDNEIAVEYVLLGYAELCVEFFTRKIGKNTMMMESSNLYKDARDLLLWYTEKGYTPGYEFRPHKMGKKPVPAYKDEYLRSGFVFDITNPYHCWVDGIGLEKDEWDVKTWRKWRNGWIENEAAVRARGAGGSRNNPQWARLLDKAS